jgi:hypothetical protein
MSAYEMKVTLFEMEFFLKHRLADVSSEIGVSAIEVADYANCTVNLVAMAIAKKLLPGYATQLMHNGKHVRVVLDKNLMSDFSIDLYSANQSELSDRQRLQVQVARIINTSVSDAKSAITSAESMLVLHLARHFGADKKTLIRALDVEIKKREGKA